MKIVIYKDDKQRYPYLIHKEVKEKISLGLREYPEVEQDYYTSKEQIEYLRGKELKEAKKFIKSLVD